MRGMMPRMARIGGAMNCPPNSHGANSGSRRFGRPPQPPSSIPHPKAQRNFTAPESRIMPASDAKGSIVQGDTCQAAVDARAQIIVAADVTDEANDKQQA